MVRVIKETRTLEHDDNTTTQQPTVRKNDDVFTAARLVYIIAGIIIAILAFRFLLALFGANREAAFADFIYSISYPFASPFFGLFSYDAQYGVSKFEIGTLIAMAFYAFVAWVIVKLITINRPDIEA